MSLKNLTIEELEEKFENFIFNIDDYLESFIDKAEEQGYNLDYSTNSLNDLENYLTKNKIDKDNDDVNDAAAYFGEVVRKNYGGNWICSLDIENNSLYYGKPVIVGHTQPKDLQLSPFDSVLIFVIRPRKNHFLKVVKNHIDPEELDLDEFPTENG
ncbi:hypothetical protein ASE74_15850 [Pedobacter sp. Leaf216]|uniref:hypothetical protein n=1 Tax=Pedobacter sp. Leaf216 TaxID=1735684 RepID=UPI0006FC94B2|nr:hypothetical protein [Pedobacter sp. Leaf216]KQM77872.1 hypothetical protein ASE74_15850 [Pedobacter sp. Leaf216]